MKVEEEVPEKVENIDFNKDSSEDHNIIPKGYLNRGHYMESMSFPENSDELIIIPSNQKGTGFIKTCYDPRLKGIMSEQEFKFIIDQAAKINAKAFSQKRLADSGQTPKWFVWSLTVVFSLTFIGQMLLYFALMQDYDMLMVSAYGIIAFCFVLAVTVMILNYKTKDVKTVQYSKIVKAYLDRYFYKVNDVYKRRGLYWKVARGHYWIELHIDTSMPRNQKHLKKKTNESANDQYQQETI